MFLWLQLRLPGCQPVAHSSDLPLQGSKDGKKFNCSNKREICLTFALLIVGISAYKAIPNKWFLQKIEKVKLSQYICMSCPNFYFVLTVFNEWKLPIIWRRLFKICGRYLFTQTTRRTGMWKRQDLQLRESGLYCTLVKFCVFVKSCVIVTHVWHVLNSTAVVYVLILFLWSNISIKDLRVGIMR